MAAKKQPIKNPKKSSIAIFIALVLISALIYLVNASQKVEYKKVTFTEAIEQYDAENIDMIMVEDRKLKLTLKDDSKLQVHTPTGTDIFETFDPRNVDIEVKDTESGRFWSDILISVLPLIFIIFFIGLILKQAQGSANNAFSFGKSKAKRFEPEKNQITFKDVAGLKEAKEELQEVVDFLKNPKKYTKLGAKIPRGIMLYGPPGTGKTLLARAVAGEAKSPFFNISGSEFVEMFVGVGASRVRDLFAKARKNAPCIIFIDEIDAVGRKRGSGVGGGNDEREQTLNQILVEMDGFDNRTNVIVIAATNRADVLDKALLRPGRFDRSVTIDMPDVKAREEILQVHSKNKPVEKDVDYSSIARKTVGFSGADLMNVMNESAIYAAKLKHKKITQSDIDESIAKIHMGPERKSKVRTEEDLLNTAYHEAGHALVAANLKYCHPVYKITIVSRGQSLGTTWYMPKDDVTSMKKIEFEHSLASVLAGRIAEELTFGEEKVTTGAYGDFQSATRMAREMVVKYGMSDKMGARVYNFENTYSRNYSEQTARDIDQEVLDIINAAYKISSAILKKQSAKLKEIAEALLEHETLDKAAFELILGGKQACEIA